MKILMDARAIGMTGVGTYVANILDEFDRMGPGMDVEAVMNPNAPAGQAFRGAVRVRRLAKKIPMYSLREQWVFPAHYFKSRPDLVFYPNFNTSLCPGIPFVVTIHDLIYYLFPDACPNRIARVYASVMMRHSTRNAKMVITDSLHSKNDIVTHLGIDPGRIRVIHPAVNDRYRPSSPGELFYKKYNLPKKFILYIGNHEPRKNILGLLRAYHVSQCRRDYRLVIAGRRDRRRQDIINAVTDLGLQQRVIFTDFIDSDDMSALYSAAGLFVFPSFYEGFGLPPLEAMACGTPVVSSDKASLPEVVGEAAVLIDPGQTEAIAAAMDKVLSDARFRDALIQAGFEQVRRFSWKNTAKGLVDAFKEALGYPDEI